MVSSRKKSKQTKDDASEKVEQAESSRKLFSEKALSPREKRRRQRGDLKAKNSGTGLDISTEPASTTNKKIIFDDEIEPAIEEMDEVNEEPVEEQNEEEQDDDDDDAVEEVKGGEARDKIVSQMKAERETVVRPKKKKKRKERKQAEKEEDEEEELDDDFFAQVDSVMSEEQKKRKLQDADKPKSTHTTFVFHQEDKEADAPKPVDHNIQVVVLKEQSTASMASAVVAVPTTKLSEEAMLYSRGRLVDGKDGGSPPQRGKKRQKKEDPTWHRSKKMNNLVLARARVNRRGGRGNAKALFGMKS
jgi:hypothetical protein